MTLQRCWAYAVIVAGVAFAVGSWFSALNHGLGVVWESGAYVGKHGVSAAPVSQTVGAVVRIANLCAIVFVPLAMVLTLAMIGWHGSAVPGVALRRLGTEGRLLCVVIYFVLSLIGLSWVIQVLCAIAQVGIGA